MLIHASCAARDGSGVLLTGPPGSGKSDLLFRLLDHGFMLVADDQVELTDRDASPVSSLEGMLEIRGIGIVRLPYILSARVRLSVGLGRGDRLPSPQRDGHGFPVVMIDPTCASAVLRVDLALDCVLGHVAMHVGAFS